MCVARIRGIDPIDVDEWYAVVCNYLLERPRGHIETRAVDVLEHCRVQHLAVVNTSRSKRGVAVDFVGGMRLLLAGASTAPPVGSILVAWFPGDTFLEIDFQRRRKTVRVMVDALRL